MAISIGDNDEPWKTQVLGLVFAWIGSFSLDFGLSLGLATKSESLVVGFHTQFWSWSYSRKLSQYAHLLSIISNGFLVQVGTSQIR